MQLGWLADNVSHRVTGPYLYCSMKLNLYDECRRCGYKQSLSYFRGCSASSLVRDDLLPRAICRGSRKLMLIRLSITVHYKYIGLLSINMFFGMMLGAVSWGACACSLLHRIQTELLTACRALRRLRPHGPYHSVQRDAATDRCVWRFRVCREFISVALRRVVLAGKCSRSTSHARRTKHCTYAD